ncbi:MAG: Ig-like domain-containing protein [Elusimicrobia bacterium]|nr:Ig-like domain-containing protein [Elusimicrobiota bacterium]
MSKMNRGLKSVLFSIFFIFLHADLATCYTFSTSTLTQFGSVPVGAKNRLVLQIEIDQDPQDLPATISSITLSNIGSALDTDISAVRIRTEFGTGQVYSGLETQAGSDQVFGGNGITTFSGLSISSWPLTIYIVVDVSNTATPGNTLDIKISAGGIEGLNLNTNPSDLDSPSSRQIVSGVPSPTLAIFSPGPNEIGVASSQTVKMSFSTSMNHESVESGFSMQAVMDNGGNSIALPVTGVFVSTSPIFEFAPNISLANNYTYQINLSTITADFAGNPLSSAVQWSFITRFSSAVANVFSNQGVQLIAPQETFSESGSVNINLSPETTPILVDPQAISTARANLEVTFDTKSVVGMVELAARGMTGNVLQPLEPVALRFSYPDSNNDGFVDGTSLVRAKTLCLWHLDETKKLFVRIPSCSVDTAAKRVTATLPHFSVFAMIGSLDTSLADAYAYPVPFKPSQGHSQITFTNLSSLATIRIYTITGNLVRELEETDGDGQLGWDVKNKEGVPVSSGVYLYLIKSQTDTKKGKLVIIR